MARQEGGEWALALESVFGTPPPFADAAWKVIKPQQGSNMKEDPAITDLNVLTNDLDPITAEVTKRAVSGQLNMIMEAHASAGIAPENDILFQGLMGAKAVTAAMTGLAIVDENNVTVDEVDVNLAPGMSILLKIVDGAVSKDWPTAVIAITENMTPTPDNLEIYPPMPLGATLQGGFVAIPAGVHYRPKVSTSTDVSLPSIAVSRLYGDIDEYWVWRGCKVNDLALDMSVGDFVQPTFNILGIEETINEGETGTRTVGQVANPFVPLGVFLQLDDDNPVWNSNFSINYSNALGEKEGIETDTGLTGHSENTRDITWGFNFEYQNKDELVKAKVATKRRAFMAAKRNTGSENRYFAFFSGQLIANSIDTPVSERLLKYDITFKAYRWLTGSDSIFLSFL